MNKLKNKVFYLTFSILSISILSFIAIFNVQNYLEQRNNIDNNLNMASNTKDSNKDLAPPSKPDDDIEPDKPDSRPLDENIKFMDSIIYTVLLDNNNNIKDVINHSNKAMDKDKIIEIANSILNKNKTQNKHIGFLYFSNYSYTYLPNNSLVILDNTKIRNSLLISLEMSISIFIVLEVIILLITKKLTKWITDPVNESFIKQKQFIADASHELKTPLSVIIASSEALEDNPKEKKWLTNIKLESERMNYLITNLLDLAATEEKATFKFEKGNLSKTVELSLLTFEGKAYENDVKLDYKIDDNIYLKMDENSIKQLVEILLDNAIKHSYKKSTINVSLRDLNNNIELIVTNSGDDIPSCEEEKIFERFYRIDKSRNRKEGRYGLGLAIAKNIVLRHNGKISAHSNNNVTTFKVLLKK